MVRACHRVEQQLGSQAKDRGAAAVEFALVVVLLLTLVFGIFELGRIWLLQSSLSAAARDAARTMAVKNSQAEAEDAARSVFTADGEAIGFSFDPSNCDGGGRITVTLTYDAAFMTGFFGESVSLSGEGVMRCGG